MLGDIDGPGLVTRALRMGRDMRGKSFVAVVAGRLDDEQPFGEQELGAHLARAGAGAVIADTGAQTLAVVALPAKKGEKAVLEALRAAPARVGISRIVTAERLVTAVHEARKAFAATHTDPEHRLSRFEDLGILRLLMSLADTAELAGYVEDELGRLLEHDAGSANQLLPTLRAFLDCDGRKSEAAQKLFVQRPAPAAVAGTARRRRRPVVGRHVRSGSARSAPGPPDGPGWPG
jgi:purine catabolism regulator